MIINGKKIAEEIIAELKQKPVPKRFFAVFLVGNDSTSASFVRQKEKTAKALGIDFRIYSYPKEITNDKLRKEISRVALSKRCGGALVQLPLSSHLNRHYILNVIPREKDVDVLGERALGAFYAGRNPVLPPAVGTTQKILSTFNFQLSTSRVAVVGLGLLVGKPISVWLMGRVKELYLLDSSSDLSILKEADLVISGVGKAGLIKPSMLKKNASPVRGRPSVFSGRVAVAEGRPSSNGAGIIDFGYDEHGESIAGDFDASELTNLSTYKLAFYTPTPGGTGPILVAQLMENFYTLNGLSS